MAVADDPATTPEAAETYRTKAEALMLEYRIEEWQLSQAGPQATNLKPGWRTVRLCKIDNEFRTTYRYIWAWCLSHVDGRGVTLSQKEDDGEWWTVAVCVGYESDLRYAELLFTAFSLAFAGKMEPRYNPALSDSENAYIMRSAGMEGRRIAMAIYGKDDKPLRVKVRNMFRAEAAARGEDVEGLSGRGVSVATFRESYADGFQAEAARRLRRMKMSSGDTGALVLKSRKDEVDEAFYEKYPEYRPGQTINAPAIGDDRKDCEKCKKAKSGYCRDHQWLKPSTARPRYRQTSAAGYARGETAAQSVDLTGGGTSRTGRVSRGNTRALEG
jgi:hypothetical protein